jgi:hypothetical protein
MESKIRSGKRRVAFRNRRDEEKRQLLARCRSGAHHPALPAIGQGGAWGLAHIVH